MHVGTTLQCLRNEMNRFGITRVLLYDQDPSEYIGLVDSSGLMAAMYAHNDEWGTQLACDWMKAAPRIMSTLSLPSACGLGRRHIFVLDSRRIVSQGDLLKSVERYARPVSAAPDGLEAGHVAELDATAHTTVWEALQTMAHHSSSYVQINVEGVYYRLLTVNDVCWTGCEPSSKLLQAFQSQVAVYATRNTLESVVSACVQHDVHQVYLPGSTLGIATAEHLLSVYAVRCHAANDRSLLDTATRTLSSRRCVSIQRR